jgi:adenylosuccinate synthase
MGAISIQDAFWGDAGKGIVSAWVALIKDASMCERGCGGSGAEHGVFIGDTYLKTNQLPLGFILKQCPIGIGPGTAVDPKKLLAEIKKFRLKSKEVRVDYRCPIITEENIKEETESSSMRAIGSTKSGSGVALAHAVLRTAPLAKDVEVLKPFLDDIPLITNYFAKKGDIVLESSQGTMLSRYFGDYPNVTSVDVTTSSIVAGVGLNWQLLDEVILVVKALPTREGTGPMGHVEEYTVEEIKKLGIVEQSSIKDPITGESQIRRKAKSIDWNLLKYVAMLNGPTQVALTFAEHYDPDVKDVTEWSGITNKVKKLKSMIEKIVNAPVTLINTGKQITSMVGVEIELPKINNKTMQRLQSYL